MTHSLHPTAIVHPDAKLGSDVEIGPYADQYFTVYEECVAAWRAEKGR